MQKYARLFRIRLFLLLAGLLLASLATLAADPLAAGFQAPPDSAKPQTWWHWMNGNVTKEGITGDLEAMKQIGLGGAEIFNADCGIPAGAVKFNSPEWHELFTHAVREANRLGLQLEAHNCAGWSSSGGPWNAPSNGMMRVVTSEIHLTGPTNFAGVLPEPSTKFNYYHDIAIQAFRTLDGETIPAVKPKLRIEKFETKDGDTGDFVDSMTADNRPAGDAGLRRDQTVDLTAKVSAVAERSEPVATMPPTRSRVPGATAFSAISLGLRNKATLPRRA